MYSITSLRSPSSRLSRAAGVKPVFNPPSRPGYSPGQAPQSYDQQLGSLKSGNTAPNFSGAPMMADAGGGGAGGTMPAFAFSNADNPAFQNQAIPSMGASSVSGPAGTIGVDYQSDPILQQAQALYNSQVAQAEAAALGNEKTALIRYGDPRLVSMVLGKEAGNTADAASGNTFSTVAELGRWNNRSLSGIDTATNRNNLYFSSTRARDRGLQEEDLTRQSARTANQLQDLLTGIASGLLQSKQGAMAGLMGAEESAYNRALNLALQQAYYMPMTGAGGGAGGGGAASAASAPTGGSTALYDFVMGRPPAAIGGPGGVPE